MSNPFEGDKLLWIDLETTGSSEEKGDCIIEIGCILTDIELNEIGSWTLVVQPTPLGLGRMMQNPVVRQMHEKNGLLDEILSDENTFLPHVATDDLLRWLRKNGAEEGKLILAGSGVGHFDRRFINKFMPQLAKWLRYWPIDIGTIRRAYEMWTGEHLSRNEGKTHRALDDAYCHLEEARDFSRLWNGFIRQFQDYMRD